MPKLHEFNLVFNPREVDFGVDEIRKSVVELYVGKNRFADKRFTLKISLVEPLSVIEHYQVNGPQILNCLF